MEIRRDRGTKAINVGFLKGRFLVYLKGLFSHYGIGGMLKEKDFDRLDFIFPFVSSFSSEKSVNNDTTSFHMSIPAFSSFAIS